MALNNINLGSYYHIIIHQQRILLIALVINNICKKVLRPPVILRESTKSRKQFVSFIYNLFRYFGMSNSMFGDSLSGSGPGPALLSRLSESDSDKV